MTTAEDFGEASLPFRGFALAGTRAWAADQNIALQQCCSVAEIFMELVLSHFTGSMLLKMGIIDDPTCRACNEDVETMEHLLCECDWNTDWLESGLTSWEWPIHNQRITVPPN
ncbi:jg2317 [Pararge aegeria aegeria]|uniref:Jg2317 protein n=1 Tax=Pararge aegeria aegeria TaxID=348720 RepID=A0A8S4S911_9NEOP|nr:jg2317 [Pararge aegeria aegeria]